MEIRPAPLDFHICLISIPVLPYGAVAPLAQGLPEEQGQLALAFLHGFMGKEDTPLEKHLHHIPQAQFVAEAPQDHDKDNVGGKSRRPATARPVP
jgi:hypothetical protein